MKKINLIIIFILSLSFHCRKQSIREKPIVWYCGSTLKVLPELDPAPYFKDEVRIKVAHREHEPFQIVISAGKYDLEDVRVELAEPKHKDKGIVFPKSKIKLYREALVEVTKLDQDRFGRKGLYPDPLPPLTSAIMVPKGESRAIWVDIEVPEELPSGIYKGEIKVSSKGRLLSRVPLIIEVLDFSLPPLRETHLYNIVGVDPREVKKVFPELNQEEFDRFLASIYELIWAHRIMPEKIFLIKPKRDDRTGHVSFGERERRWGDHFFKKLGFFATSIIVWEDSFERLGYYSKEYNNAMVNLMVDWAEAFNRFGWLNSHKNPFLLIEYIHDETKRNVRKAYRNIERARERSEPAKRYLKKLCTVPFDKELFGAVDIWCPRIHEIDLKLLKERKEKGELVFSYVSGYPFYPDGPNGIHITHPLIDARIIFWFIYLWDIDGFLYWESTLWTYKGNDPWKTANTFWTNGNGLLIYPGTKRYVGSLSPLAVSSLRLELLREGIEDYEYFVLAERKIGKDRVKEIIKRVARKINDYEGMMSYKEPIKVYEVRERLIEVISD